MRIEILLAERHTDNFSQHKARAMEADIFRTWLDTTGTKTARKLTEQLGWSKQKAERIMQSVKANEPAKVNQVDELAMSAVAQGLRKWSNYEH